MPANLYFVLLLIDHHRIRARSHRLKGRSCIEMQQSNQKKKGPSGIFEYLNVPKDRENAEQYLSYSFCILYVGYLGS